MTDYTDIELAAAQVIASLIYPDYPGGPDLDADAAAFGLYDSAIDACREPHDAAALLMQQNGKLYDPHSDAATAWEGLRQMSGPATPYARIDPLIRAIGDEIGAQQTQAAHAALHANRPRAGPPPSGAAATSPPRYSVRDEAALLALPALRYLDRELCLIAGAYHLIYGASGSGKTFYAVERAMRQVAAGRRVLYIATEDQSNLRYAVAAWRQAHPDAGGALAWLDAPDGLDLQDHTQVAELLATIGPDPYDHIVLDTLREAHSGDENSSQDTARLNRAVQRLVATGAAVDVVHHAGVAGERPRGSTALFSNANPVIRAELDDDALRVSFEKLRDVPRDPLAFGLVQQDTGLIDSDGLPVIRAVLQPLSQVTSRGARLSVSQRAVLETLALSIFADVGAKERQIAAHVQLRERAIYRALSALKDHGYVTQATKGDPFYITREGRAQLGPDLTPAPDSDDPAAPPTVTPNTAAGRATVTTVDQLSGTVSQPAVTPTDLSVTVTTLRSDSETVVTDSCATAPTFVPTDDWQDVPDGAVCPPGLEYNLNMTTGRRIARRAPRPGAVPLVDVPDPPDATAAINRLKAEAHNRRIP
jgi:AAA domain